ncbi:MULTISPECIES: class I SAM-dependent DNA methyltransferase [Metabacillus]|uniref:Methyltransferase n=1 Tax=Metabacillus indicus TaxID=246786 RepID=A0A084GWR9_METID|nr:MULTISPECIES: class I SAM-dependent methyltransferase [Metabacillus]KEZ51092.1 methyltransferase [Metabacillus indicus LMG 22858]KEZ51781.1 methyltransferase [Metabacillus indicus]
MIYKGFAEIYDELMKDVPYGQWTDFLHERMKRFGNGGSRILDLGCGTGEISIRLKQKGYAVTGMDISEEMLSVAYQKTAELGLSIQYLQHDMREKSDLNQSFDGVFICCDSLNYLQSKEDVQSTFKASFDQLAEGGLLIFDVHSLYKIHEIFNGATFAGNDEDVSFIWNSFLGDEPGSIEHDLSFFVKRDSFYERFDEFHMQRTYSIDCYKDMIAAAGLELLEISADFSEDQPDEESERIFFTARKNGLLG